MNSANSVPDLPFWVQPSTWVLCEPQFTLLRTPCHIWGEQLPVLGTDTSLCTFDSLCGKHPSLFSCLATFSSQLREVTSCGMTCQAPNPIYTFVLVPTAPCIFFSCQNMSFSPITVTIRSYAHPPEPGYPSAPSRMTGVMDRPPISCGSQELKAREEK